MEEEHIRPKRVKEEQKGQQRTNTEQRRPNVGSRRNEEGQGWTKKEQTQPMKSQ